MRLTILMIAVLAIPVHAAAATIAVGPSNCSASAVNSAIASANDGDTIQLTCTGTTTWTSTVTIPNTKGITLMVQGGSNTPKASANFPLTVIASANITAVRVTVGSNKALSRVSGFKFQNSGTADPFIHITGQGVGRSGFGGFRFDNNYLDQISGAAILQVFSNGGPLYGLIDNNTMHNVWRESDQDYGPYVVQIWNDWHGTDACWGKDGWTNAFNFGDASFVFVEDNVFENIQATPNRYTRHYISGELGGRFVSRYNNFNVTVRSPGGNETDMMEGHGLCLCDSNGAGVRGGEIYRNTISGTAFGRPIMPRGGTWLIYDNVFNAVGSYGTSPYLLEYRAGSSSDQGQCSSTCPCVTNWTAAVGSSTAFYPLPQQVSGTYIWNNLYQGVNQSGQVDPSGVQRQYIQPGRDYFVSTGKPAALSSYTPYTYPHPLRGTLGVPPSAPSSLNVQ